MRLFKRIEASILLFSILTALGFADVSVGKEEYAARRSRLMEKIPDGAAVFLGAKVPAGSFRFFQGNDFYYFTGLEIPDAVLIIDGVRKASVLFFSMSEEEARSEGLSVEIIRNSREATGIERILPREQFSSFLAGLSQRAGTLYTMFKPEELSRDNSSEKFNALQRSMTLDVCDGRLTRELQFVNNLKGRFPQVMVKDCSALVWDMRKIKSQAEVELLRRAARIAVKAHIALLEAAAPGAAEQELAALFEYTCKMNGAHDLAYYVILMSGPNHAFGHYHKHDRTLRDGDFIILDAGPDIGYYNADVSSTFPANGRFSTEQKKLYELALGIREVCLNAYRPGITFKDVGEKVRRFLVQNGVDPEDPKFRGLVRYGGYNHSIGMATHDVQASFAGPDEVLTPGYVFACDINLPYPEDEMGVRLEDTVLITGNGSENFSDGLPRTVAEIEARMKKR
jgi:Xaa-Pro aminopeptidase